jgi:site-specific DNA-cytosine methylase
VPNRRRRVFIVASMHGDARDVLLAQVGQRQGAAAFAA